MEVFGSDESKPVDFSIAQVRQCKVFIGVYAERYGTVDDVSGKSITELEYLEACRMLREQQLRAMLIYVIDPKANWPLDLIDREPAKIAALQAFKRQILKHHTVSFFTDTRDLPFLILRDVIKKLNLAGERLFTPRNRRAVKLRKSLDRPVGMEYYGEELSRLFFGRESELEVLEKQVLNHKMSLLIGASGVGKTSLLCAGLLPRLREIGWSLAWVRPLTEPIQNLKRFVWDQLLEGNPPSELDFPSVVRAAAIAQNGRRLLIIIDQFEDVLAARNPGDVSTLTADLFNIFNMAQANLAILLCYRGDVECELGAIWQTISGSPEGLPRTYLNPLNPDKARNVIESTLKALRVMLDEGARSKPSLLETILGDLATESLASGQSGIYPPFVQILIGHLFEGKDKKGIYHAQTYNSAGQTRKIIADFLLTQLKYLGAAIEIGKGILIALVSSYGTKTQKSLKEISAECLLPNVDVRDALSKLIDLRLARKVDETYEIAHDFLARTIFSELVSPSHLETKKFKDLLASRAIAYDDTKACLTKAEHLHIYRVRNKILCSESEVKLLLASYLEGNGPIAYWGKNYSKVRLKDWTRGLMPNSEPQFLQAAHRFLIKLGDKPRLSALAEAFSDYKQQAELANYITSLATNADMELLVALNRKKAERVVRASEIALVRLATISNTDLLIRMASSNSRNTSLAFERVALKVGQALRLSDIREGLRSEESWRRLLSIYALAVKGKADDIQALHEILASKVPQKYRVAATKSITRLALRLGQPEIVRTNLRSSDHLTIEKTLEAIDTPSTFITIEELFSFYKAYPQLSADAIYNTCVPSDRAQLKKILKTVCLEPSARELVYALCKIGNEEDFSFLFRLLRDYSGVVNFWNAFAVVERISDLATVSHISLLKRIIDAEEFWRYYREDERPKIRIVVADFGNVYLMKRLAAVAFGKVATRSQLPTIFRMLKHDFWVVRNGALNAIKRYGNADDLEMLVKEAIEHPVEAEGLVTAVCALDEMINKIS